MIIPNKPDAENASARWAYGALSDAAYDVGDHMSVALSTVLLSVKVNQKVGECYNVTITYTKS